MELLQRASLNFGFTKKKYRELRHKRNQSMLEQLIIRTSFIARDVPRKCKTFHKTF